MTTELTRLLDALVKAAKHRQWNYEPGEAAAEKDVQAAMAVVEKFHEEQIRKATK
jgi:hypothetical protein